MLSLLPCYLSVPPDPGIEAAALGASASAALGTGESAAPGAGESALSGSAPTEALHTFILDSGASRSFFRDSTTLTPLSRPVTVSLADPSGGPVLAHSSTVLSCPPAPSGLLSGLQLPSFSTNLVSGADLQDAWVDQFTPGAAPGQVFAAVSRSSPTSAPCSCRPLSHETLLWHHRLGHPSLPRLRGMASRTLVLGLPRSLPPLPPGPAPACVLCVEDRQRAAPHSSEFPPTKAPLQTLHMDVWGPARVCGQGHERYFLLVVDDYSHYTTVFPLRCKDRGGEFSFDLLRAFCCAEGIRQTFTLPASPQKNGIAERRIGMVMDVARTSMIHAAAPHFLWPFAVQYAAHHMNLQPRVSLPETTPTLRWTGKVDDVSVFRVWGSRAFVRDTSVDKLSSCAVPCVFLGFPPDAPGWQFYHPTSRRVLSSKDVTFDKSVSYYRLFPYRIASLPPPPLFLAPGTPPVDPLPPQGPAPSALGAPSIDPLPPQCPSPSGVSQVDPAKPVEVAAGVGAVGGTGAGGAAGVVAGDPGAEGTGAVSAVSGGAARPRPYYVPLLQQVLGLPPSLGPSPPLLSPPPVQSQPQLQLASPLPGPSPYTGPTRGLTERREPKSRPASPESCSVSPVCAVRADRRVSRPRSPPVPGTHSMTLRPSTAPQRVPLPSPPASSLPDGPDTESNSLRASCPAVPRFLATVVTDPLFESTAAFALVAELVDFAAACRLDYAAGLVAESASAFVCPPSVGGECALGTDVLEDRQEEFACFASAVSHLVSMLLAPEGDPDAPYIPTPRSYAEAIEGPYSTYYSMDAEMASWKSTCTYVDEVPPPGANIVSGMWIFRVKRPPGSPPVFKARYVARGFSQRQGVDFFETFFPTPKMTTLRVVLYVAAQRDYELHSLDFSTAFLWGSLHEEIWLRRPPGFTGPFPAGTQWSLRRPVYDLRQAPREWHDTLRTTLAALGFAPSTADPTLFLRTDTTLQPFYVLVYVDDLVFATADTEALAHVKSELQKRHTCIDLGPSALRLHVLLTTIHFLPTSHSLSDPPLDESVEPSGPYPELVGYLMYLMTCTRPDLAYPHSLLTRYVAPGRHRKVHWDAAKRVLRYLCSTSRMGLVRGGRARVALTGHADASWVDDLTTQRSSLGYTFSLGSDSVSSRSTRSSSVLNSSCEAKIYAGAMAAQELRWLTHLLTELGEAPRSPPVLYVDNKAMLALCQEHRLEHRTKHIALRYFLARDLQQRGQLRLAYVASRANIADVFTKALQPCDHQRFCTVLGLVPTVPHLLTS
ncbi:unnamed protein product [Closterium sp. NIES-53]